MSDVSGFIVALIAAQKVGILNKFMKKETNNGTVYEPGVKPKCGPGYYAKFNTTTDRWSCESIPSGR